MTTIARLGLLTLIGAGMVHVQPAQADPIHGRWKVRSYVSTTMTLDGKEKVKGPFTDKPASMLIAIGPRSYVTEDGGKRTTYTIRRAGRDYVLSRRAEDGPVSIRLSRIRVVGKTLRFTSTRMNRPRQERYVVEWTCVAAPKREVQGTTLVGTRWQLAEIAYNDDKVVRPAADDRMTLEFPAAGRVAGMAGLNRFNGTLTIQPDRAMRIGQLAVTRAAVLPGSVADTYIRDLQSAKRYLLDKGMLVLELPYDVGVMKFRKL